MGHRLPSPRLTRAGFGMMLKYIALPMLTLLAVFDGVMFLFFRYVLDRCYGVWCLF